MMLASGFFDEGAQFSQGIADALLFGEEITERGDDAAGQRNVAGLHFHTGRRSEGFDNRQERIGGQHRRFVGVGIDNLCHCSGVSLKVWVFPESCVI